MIQDIRVGVPIIGGDWWMGGVSYIELLVHAVTSLPKSNRPQLYLVVSDSNLRDYSHHRSLIPHMDGVIYVGDNHSEANLMIREELIVFSSHNELFSFIDFYYPVNTDTIPRKNAGTWIPDFQHYYLPELFSETELEWRNSQFHKVENQSHLIVFSSEDAKKDFNKYFPDSKAMTEVLHFYAMPNEKWYEPDPNEVRERYEIPEKFIICSNQFWLHKNHKKLFEAFSMLGTSGEEIALVCTGSTSDYRSANYFKELQEYLQQLGISEKVHILGMIPRDEQIQLIRGSLFVVQPSLFEGWSTVVEDSRVLGKSILLSDLDVNIEQAPEYGVYFKRNDAKDLAEKLIKLIVSSTPGPDIQRELNAKIKAKENIDAYAKQFCKIVNISNQAKSSRYESWLQECEELLEKKMKAINDLEVKLKESEADRQVRMDMINYLQHQITEIDADRTARLQVIERLQSQVEEIEADRAARLEVINLLQVQLMESEADRAARLEVINRLQSQLAESEADREARLQIINRLVDEKNKK